MMMRLILIRGRMTRAILLVLALAACGHVARSQDMVSSLTIPASRARRSRMPSRNRGRGMNDDDTGEDDHVRAKNLKRMPTISVSQADDLKISTPYLRVWLSRCGVEDGEPYSDKVTRRRWSAVAGSYTRVSRLTHRAIHAHITRRVESA